MEKKYADQQREGFRKALTQPLDNTPPFRGFNAAMRYIRPKAERTIVDVGCGTGGYAGLIDRLWPYLTYRGCDISPLAIEYAVEDYGNRFFVCDVLDLHEGAYILLASSLVEVCPNWQEVLAHLLALPFEWLILSRVRVWHDANRPTVGEYYQCVYGTRNFMVTHNKPELADLIRAGSGRVAYRHAYQVDSLFSLLTMVIQKEPV